jgi:LPS export ABC transporter protein LptC
MKVLFAAFVAVVISAACRKDTRPPVVPGQSLADSAEQVIYDGHFLLTRRGVKSGELFSDTIFVFNDQTRFALRRVRATFNTETGAPNGTLRGDRGTYDLRSQMLEGFGNVVVESVDGRKLMSNQLRYAQMKNEISSDSAYTLVRKDETQRGIGFVSDPNLNAFRCLRACGGEALVPLQTLPKP